MESLFNKVAPLKRLYHNCFSMTFSKLLKTLNNKAVYTIKIAYN